MNPQITLTRRKTLLGATTLAAASAFGSESPIRVAPSPAYAQAAANRRGDDGQYVFERGFPTPETARRAHDEQDYQRGVQAYQFFYPTISMEGIFQGIRDAGAGDNNGAMIFACGPRNVLFTANSDTPYLFSVLNLKQSGPTVIELPAGPYLGLFNDHNFRWIADVGLPGPDAGKGGKHLVLPPEYEGEVPAGYYPARSNTNFVWWATRALPTGADIKGALDALRRIRVYPLAQSANPPAYTFVDNPTKRLTPVPCAGRTTFSIGRSCTRSCKKSRLSTNSVRCMASSSRLASSTARSLRRMLE
jgi:hypothetical protein